MQGQFTKEETRATEDAFTKVFKALSKNKQRDLIGHADDIYLFLAAAHKAAPAEKKKT